MALVAAGAAKRRRPVRHRYRRLGGQILAHTRAMPRLRRPRRGYGALFAFEHRRSGQSCRAELRGWSPLPDAGGRATGAGAGTAGRAG